jgi:hypothetical protein
MNPDVYHVGKSSLPAIVIDPTDESGKTLYLTGNWFFQPNRSMVAKLFPEACHWHRSLKAIL